MLIQRRKLLLAAPALILARPASAFWQSRDSNYNAGVAAGGGGGGSLLIDHGATTSTNGNGFGVTINSSQNGGANLIVMGVGWYTGGSGVSISDNLSNGAPVGMTANTVGTGSVRLFYYDRPTVGSSHIITVTGVGSFPALFVAAFSGALTTPAGQENSGGSVGGTSAFPATTTTPSQNNELIVSMVAGSGTSYSVDSSFIPTNVINYAGNGYGGGFGYLKQTTAAAVQPGWSWTTAGNAACVLATFKFA